MYEQASRQNIQSSNCLFHLSPFASIIIDPDSIAARPQITFLVAAPLPSFLHASVCHQLSIHPGHYTEYVIKRLHTLLRARKPAVRDQVVAKIHITYNHHLPLELYVFG